MNVGMVAVVVVIALGVLADGVVIVTHLGSAIHTNAPSTTQPAANQASQHPCNHGFYVSQAAHAKKGGAYVKQIAKSDLGKTGNCTAPLPAPAATPKASSQQGDD
jgi:hypothetical protein